MKCPQCQAENREGAQFCRQCGVKFEISCPACGKTNLTDSKFCDGCGEALAPTPFTPLSKSPTPTFTADKTLRERISPEGERKHVTVLYSDLSGYTALSENLDPEGVKEITTRIFAEVAQIVSRYEGFVEKCVGDRVIALFGVPKAHEDDHVRAIKTAREIHDFVKTIGREYREKISAPLTFHAGITTGLVVAGEVDLEKGTIGMTGGTINLASRLSGLAKPGEILVGESTYLQSKGTFSFERLSPASVKGKAEPVTPYRLVEEKAEPAKGLTSQSLTSPLVGRTAEVAAVKGCINRLLDGLGGILSLIGEAGLGKSRLMAEIHRSYQNENLLWLEGKTLSYGQKMSYWPFREILWQYAGITEDDSDTEACDKFERKILDLFPTESGEIIPYLASLIGLEVRGDLGQNLRYLDGEAMGRQIYLSSRRFFEKLARGSPLVLVFEDLHWADESTVALIEHLFPLITRAPLLICGVTRPEAAVPAARLRDSALNDHERRYTEIRLNPLSPTECTDLMNNLISIENLSSRTRQLILTRADGNPFFVEEIMRTFVDRGAVRYDNGRWRVTSAIDTITIPDTIQGLIMARIDRLDDELKQVLRTASVIGRAFLYRLLREVTEAVRELDRHLDTLTATELIREKQRLPELEYIFKHALVQESTYESILLKKRMELHGKVACAIETLFSDRLDEFSSVLAYHYAKAESWEKGQEYLFKAGDQAGRIAADAEALTHYQQALETYTRAFGDKWDPIQRGILERKMGEAFYRRGEPEKGMEYFQRALVYLGRPRLPTSRWKVRLSILREIGIQLAHRLFSGSLVKRTYGQAGQAVEEVSRIYEIVMYHDVAFAPEHLLLTMLTYLNFSERKGHLPGIVFPSVSLVVVLYLFSLFRLGRFLSRRAVILARQTEDPSALGELYVGLTFRENSAGQLDKALEYGLKGVEIVRMRGYWHLAMWGWLNNFVSLAYRHRGDLRSALAAAQEMVRFGQDANELWVVAMGLYCLGAVQELMGDFQGCVATLTKAVEMCEAIPDHLHRVWSGCYLGRCYCRMGDLERSLSVLAQADTYRAMHGARGWDYRLPLALFDTYLAVAEHDVGPRRDEYLRKARGACKSVFRWAKGYPVSLPEAARLRGVYDWLTGRHSSAEAYWNCSLTWAEEMGMRYDLAMTHLEMGRRLDDREHLQKAEAIFADIGAEWDLEQARRYLRPLADRKEA